MKAWEYIHDLTANAVPVLLSEEEQTWTAANDTGEDIDAQLRLQWESHVPGSYAPESVIIAAVEAMESKGMDVSEAEKLIPEGLAALKNGDMLKLNAVTARLLKAIYSAPVDDSAPYWGYRLYDDYESYKAAVIFPESVPVDLESPAFAERTKNAWLGRLAGGALGTELEGYTTEQLQKKFGEVTFYLRKPNTYNDDITYELAFLFAVLDKGKDLDSASIADWWLSLIPSGWSAEQAALDNLRRGIYPPESGRFRNAWNEWIGAQMRGAICGQVAPGNPELAARLAWMDGEISHVSNGILGEVFNAVLVSLAYVKSSVREILSLAINTIPADSEYRSVLDFAWEGCVSGDFHSAWRSVEKRYQRYNWIHAYPNAAAEVLALYFGNGDFDKTMNLIAMAGQDVDCNAAQVGAMLGAMGSPVRKEWTEPFEGRITTYLRKYRELEVEDIAKKTVAAALKLQP